MTRGGRTLEDKRNQEKEKTLRDLSRGNEKALRFEKLVTLEKVKRAKQEKEVVSCTMELDREKMPEKYLGIDTFVRKVKNVMRSELNNQVSQAQMLVLDSLTEVLRATKIISGHIIEHNNILTDSSQAASNICNRFLAFQTALDRKICLFYKLDAVFGMKKESEQEKMLKTMGLVRGRTIDEGEYGKNGQ